MPDELKPSVGEPQLSPFGRRFLSLLCVYAIVRGSIDIGTLLAWLFSWVPP